VRSLPIIPILGPGAIVPLEIGVSDERRRLLRPSQRLEPAPVFVTMLIDTGATCSWIRTAYMDQLGLKPRSWFEFERINGDEAAPSYEVSLILGGVATPLVRRFEVLIGGMEFKDKPHDGLLGRDVLRRLHFHWNGPGGQVQLNYT
jgi:hypothetical protein